jgi:hypothetical protein
MNLTIVIIGISVLSAIFYLRPESVWKNDNQGEVYRSGVSGVVLLGPNCPVLRNPPDPNCADKLYRTSIKIISISGDSRINTTIESDEDGKFLITLPPGEYSLQAEGVKPFPRCGSKNVVIEPDIMHNLDIMCDTGLG